MAVRNALYRDTGQNGHVPPGAFYENISPFPETLHPIIFQGHFCGMNSLNKKNGFQYAYVCYENGVMGLQDRASKLMIYVTT
jgi:hypothetical protein